MSDTTVNDSRIIVALDFDSADKARELVAQLDPALCKLKIGKELFTRSGPAIVTEFVDKGFQIFLDLKFHDIPNTVAKACAAAADLGVWMMNVHAQGGSKMMEAANNAVKSSGDTPPLLIAVTILTSLTEDDIQSIGLQGSTQSNVTRLASLANDAGLDGVVCSPLEVYGLRKKFSTDFKLVTPGVRMQGSSTDDQTRVTTPKMALEAGSDYLVIGRPITQAGNPLSALQSINDEIK